LVFELSFVCLPFNFSQTGDVYTGVSDGRIVRIRNDRYKTVAQFGDPEKCINPWEIEKCGRPLGLRFDSKGLLYVADAYYGLHTVNVTSGKITRILSSKKKIGSRKPRFLDDLVISEGKTGSVIYFTDASKKWDLKNVFYTVGEHDESGRVIKFDTRTKNATVLMKNLGFPNGIELTDDKTAILVCEFNNRRIMRHYVKGDRRGQTDVFSFNLPGEPDNIRRSSDPQRETYWVALAMGRNVKNPSFAIDHLSGWPKVRKASMRLLHLIGSAFEYAGKILHFRLLTELGFKIKTGAIMFYTITHYGLAVELDADGKIIQSLHSPDGRTTLLSEVREVIVGDKKVLYLGSYGNNYIGKMTLGTLQQLQRPLLTHDKKQYIEQKPMKSMRSPKYRPHLPFDMKRPHFGQQSYGPEDFDLPDFKPTKKTKSSNTKSSKTSKPKSNKKNK
jgi:sugar lactone lactonase YvrE